MTKKHNNLDKNNDDNCPVPPGEDQYILGWDDAIQLEKTMSGLAKVFFESDVILYSHSEYIKGFIAAANSNGSFKDD